MPHYSTQRIPMIGADRLAVKMGRHYEIILQYNFQWQVDGESVFGMLHHMRGFRLDLEKTVFHHCLNRDTLPNCIELAPTRDTMNIHLDFSTRQSIEFVPGPALLFLH